MAASTQNTIYKTANFINLQILILDKNYLDSLPYDPKNYSFRKNNN